MVSWLDGTWSQSASCLTDLPQRTVLTGRGGGGEGGEVEDGEEDKEEEEGEEEKGEEEDEDEE